MRTNRERCVVRTRILRSSSFTTTISESPIRIKRTNCCTRPMRQEKNSKTDFYRNKTLITFKGVAKVSPFATPFLALLFYFNAYLVPLDSIYLYRLYISSVLLTLLCLIITLPVPRRNVVSFAVLPRINFAASVLRNLCCFSNKYTTIMLI